MLCYGVKSSQLKGCMYQPCFTMRSKYYPSILSIDQVSWLLTLPYCTTLANYTKEWGELLVNNFCALCFNHCISESMQQSVISLQLGYLSGTNWDIFANDLVQFAKWPGPICNPLQTTWYTVPGTVVKLNLVQFVIFIKRRFISRVTPSTYWSDNNVGDDDDEDDDIMVMLTMTMMMMMVMVMVMRLMMMLRMILMVMMMTKLITVFNSQVDRSREGGEVKLPNW